MSLSGLLTPKALVFYASYSHGLVKTNDRDKDIQIQQTVNFGRRGPKSKI